MPANVLLSCCPVSNCVIHREHVQTDRTSKAVRDMSWMLEICCRSASPVLTEGAAIGDALAGTLTARLAGLKTLDLYEPCQQETRDPYNNDRDGPFLIAMAEFAERQRLQDALGRLEACLKVVPEGTAITATPLQRKIYPVGGEAAARPLAAPFSYVVRYFHPASDAAAFVDAYVAEHPATLGKLPNIRSVMCYFPFASKGPVPCAPYIIGNEVAFDSVEDFNTAMQSPVRQALRDEFHRLPPYSGVNAHYPMLRRRCFS
jgi:hypothetical protein